MTGPTRLIRAARPKPFRAVISLGLLALAGLMFLGAPDPLMQAMSWAALALAAVLALRLAARGLFAPDILLSPTGFEVKGLAGSGPVPWSAVARFGQADLRRASFVIYSLKARPFDARRRPARLRGLPPEADGYLAQTPEMSVPQLLALMNEWKTRHGGG